MADKKTAKKSNNPAPKRKRVRTEAQKLARRLRDRARREAKRRAAEAEAEILKNERKTSTKCSKKRCKCAEGQTHKRVSVTVFMLTRLPLAPKKTKTIPRSTADLAKKAADALKSLKKKTPAKSKGKKR